MSSRGLRTHLGPRAARIHVGGGRTGVSTGAGPVTLYSSLTSSGSRRSPSRRASTAASTRSAAAAAKAEEAQQLADTFRQIDNIHREQFDAAQPPIAAQRPTRDPAPLIAAHQKAALAGIGLLHRSARAQAREVATGTATAELAALRASDIQARASLQKELDSAWDALLRNDPDTVLTTLAEAFEDNGAAAAAVGLEGGAVSLVVTVPSLDAIPARYPAITDAGNLSLRKLTKTDRNAWYRRLISGCVLVTVKEAFAVGPRLTTARIVAARQSGVDAFSRPVVEAVFACQIDRVALTGVDWDRADADRIIADTCQAPLIRLVGSAQQVQPLDLSSEPEIAALIAAIDVDPHEQTHAGSAADPIEEAHAQQAFVAQRDPTAQDDPSQPGSRSPALDTPEESTPAPPPPPAAWYPDPQDAARLRYWDGLAWTPHTSE